MKVFKWLDQVEKYAAGILFLGAMAVSLCEVFMRYFLNKPQAWTTEFLEYLMVWAIFIGFGRALKENHHIVVDIVYDKLPFLAKRILAVLGNLLGTGYSLLLTVNGISQVAIAKANGTVTVSVGIPIWITYLIMPIGMGLLCFYFILKTYRAVIGDKREVIGELELEGVERTVEDKGVSI